MTPAGLEPATYCLGGSRSIHLSYEVDFPIDIIYQVRSRFSSHAWASREQIESLHELGFAERKENVVFLGPPDVGRAIWPCLAIGTAESGRRVYYGSLAKLIRSLEEAQAASKLVPQLD